MSATKEMPRHSAATEAGRLTQNRYERNPINMSSIVDLEVVAVECRDAACDFMGRDHVVPAGMEPALHEIRLTTLELSRADKAGEKWHAWLTQPEAEYGVDELTQLQADVTKALAMLRDLNAA